MFYDSIGNIISGEINCGYPNSIFYKFYPNHLLERIVYESKNFNEQTDFFENGKIERIWNHCTQREYYPNGQVKKDKFEIDNNNYGYNYYYDTGELMAIYFLKSHIHKKKYVTKKMDGNGKIIKKVSYSEMPSVKTKWKCYDRKGKRIKKEDLMKIGYDLIRN